MKSSLRFLFLFALVAGLVTATGTVPAMSDTPPASDLVRVVVTALGRHGNPAPVVTGDELLVYQNNQRRPVVDWQPAAAASNTQHATATAPWRLILLLHRRDITDGQSLIPGS